MSTLTANTVCSGVAGQLPVVRRWSRIDGRSTVSISQPVGLCSKPLPYSGRSLITFDSGGIKDLSLKCSISSSQLSRADVEAIPFGGKRQGPMSTRSNHSLICFSALNARCGAEQTQTITRESSTITVAPVDGKADLSPKIDDGGSGFPPRDDDDGGGGGGGGGGNWSGGFFFFGFLAFLGFLKDKEKEGPYDD